MVIQKIGSVKNLSTIIARVKVLMLGLAPVSQARSYVEPITKTKAELIKKNDRFFIKLLLLQQVQK
jgi:hypothetical protein